MPKYEVSWVDAPEIQPQDVDKTCKQVYVWILTKDKHVLIVSKDGEQWQLPGGKPRRGELLKETAVREVWEETNLDIAKQADRLRFLGYQTVNEVGSEEPPYLQVRYLLELNDAASALELGVQHEDCQPQEDMIRFVGAVSLNELTERMPWLGGSPEFNAVQSLIAPQPL